MNARISREPKLDFRQPWHKQASLDQHFELIAQSVGDMAMQHWGKTPQFRAAFANNDAMLHSASSHATTAMIAGLFTRPDLATPWADGSIITITDSGAGIGDKNVEWEEAGVTDSTQDDGITALDQSQERTVDVISELKTARFHKIEHKMQIGFFEIAQAAKSGYDKQRLKGEKTRRKHYEAINRLIRRGSAAHNLRGVINYPGILHKVSTVDWATANAGPIYDELNESIDAIGEGLDNEQPEPEMLVLPRRVNRHMKTENFGTGTDTTLRSYLLANNEQLEIVVDPGMSDADSNGHPGALFLTPSPDLIWCTMPVFAQVQQPILVPGNQWMIEVAVWSYFAGVQIAVPESVLFLDGKAAGWGE
jgi:hypothetical protein